jgi:hypothetical protein
VLDGLLVAIARLASQDASATSTMSTLSAVYAATPTANNLLIAVVVDSGLVVATITGWTEATHSAAATAQEVTILYKVATGSESTTVTASAPGSFRTSLAIMEYSGLATSSPQDSAGTATSNSGASQVTTLTIGPTGTLSQASELAIAGIASSNQMVSETWTGGFSARFNKSNTTGSLIAADNIVSAKTALTTSPTWTGSNTVAGAIVTFKGKAVASGYTIQSTTRRRSRPVRIWSRRRP